MTHDASLPATLDHARAVLLRYFGYSDFRPSQIRAVKAVLSGRDAMLLLPTGGGKSICYQVPALAREGLTIVVSPLISLMKDQVETLERRGVHAAFVNSTLAAADVASRLAQAADGTLRLLYLSPERMESRRMIEQLQQCGIALLAVDEAHCISEWGHDFRPSYRRLAAMRRELGSPQTVALTATATPEVRMDIVTQLELDNPEIVVAGFDRTNLVYHVVPTKSPLEKDKEAIRLLQDADGVSVVYAPTRKVVERVAATLVRGRIRAVVYHGGLSDGERQRAQDAFMTEQANVIVATSAFGMGIDKPNVRLVVHHAMSGSLEAYYQEAGRAGRDGEMGTCVLLYTPSDRTTHEFFIDGSHPERAAVEQTWRTLRTFADATAFVPVTTEELLQQLPSKIGERVGGAALRVLIAAGIVTVEPASRTRVRIRLLATVQRISRELVGEREFDRNVLAWIRSEAGPALEMGTTVDLDDMPRYFGGPMAVVPAITRLASGQFVTCEQIGSGFQLDARSRDANWLPVDWRALERRRTREIARLDAMQGYAETHACRRAFVLRYFGDPDARPQCGACDRCLGVTQNLPAAVSTQPSRRSPATPRRT